MSRFFWLIFTLIPGLFACQNKQEAKQTIPDDKLSVIMADLYIAEAATSGLSGYPKDSLMKVYQGQVFELHGITAEAYESDLRIVSNDLTHLKQIVLAAQEKLENKGVN